MYWNRQEGFIFDIILFILAVFQVLTFLILRTQDNELQNSVFLAGINVLLFLTMIPYAKWVWKTQSYRKALLILAKHEVILVGLIIFAILLAMLLTGLKIHT